MIANIVKDSEIQVNVLIETYCVVNFCDVFTELARVSERAGSRQTYAVMYISKFNDWHLFSENAQSGVSKRARYMPGN